MIRSFISASIIAVSVFVTGCAGTQQYQLPGAVANAVNNRIARAIDPQYQPEAQVSSQSQGSNPCPRGVLTGWQGSRPICALGQQASSQNQTQQQPQQQSNNPCPQGKLTGWQGNRPVCQLSGSQQGGTLYQPQQQQQYQAPKPVGYAPANNLFAGCAPGQYNYNGACYASQQTQAPSIAGSACRTVNTVYGPRQQC